MTNMKRGLCKIARTLSQGDPSLGKDSTAVFQTSCKAVSIRIARSNPAASLAGKCFFILMQLFLLEQQLRNVHKTESAHATSLTSLCLREKYRLTNHM